MAGKDTRIYASKSAERTPGLLTLRYSPICSYTIMQIFIKYIYIYLSSILLFFIYAVCSYILIILYLYVCLEDMRRHESYVGQ